LSSAAPALTADSSGNIAGKSVDLTFSDDPVEGYRK